MRARTPFIFQECITLVELTGRSANNFEGFLRAIEEVHPSVIFHHTHHPLLRHHFVPPEYPNDFARWAADSFKDRALAERLANIDPFEFTDVEELRASILAILRDHRQRLPPEMLKLEVPRFYFDSSVSIVFPSQYQAIDLREFRQALARINPGSIYFHFFEARLRTGARIDDFSNWIEQNFAQSDLVQAIRRIDPYVFSLEELREQLINLVSNWELATELKQ